MLSIGTVVMGVQDLERAVGFWTRALEYVPRDPVAPGDRFVVLVPASGPGARLALQVSESPAEEHPRVHVDLYAGDAADQAAEVERLVGLGAGRVAWDLYPDDPDFVVLADPDGNRFCVIDTQHGAPPPLRPIGRVASPLTERERAPKQGHEGSPEAWLELDPALAEGLADLRPGERVIVLTWFDRAERDVLRVRPRDDPRAEMRGVFSTRSPDRPNPIGLHPVEIVEVDGSRLRVRDMEALDGTPILDLKPVLDRSEGA
ncbi:MAG TPA: tRNA (N6-threonylcarbamoyladenosine(37)-N6)-methyltransferase TrmO [Acidimicrobiales bacterium]|nr:tRNA (N6-threonylcarbamoyladenosine(37)-N6)-methyltransferase TrmO [Acidimicrobiales bacterium]